MAHGEPHKYIYFNYYMLFFQNLQLNLRELGYLPNGASKKTAFFETPTN